MEQPGPRTPPALTESAPSSFTASGKRPQQESLNEPGPSSLPAPVLTEPGPSSLPALVPVLTEPGPSSLQPEPVARELGPSSPPVSVTTSPAVASTLSPAMATPPPLRVGPSTSSLASPAANSEPPPPLDTPTASASTPIREARVNHCRLPQGWCCLCEAITCALVFPIYLLKECCPDCCPWTQSFNTNRAYEMLEEAKERQAVINAMVMARTLERQAEVTKRQEEAAVADELRRQEHLARIAAMTAPAPSQAPAAAGPSEASVRSKAPSTRGPAPAGLSACKTPVGSPMVNDSASTSAAVVPASSAGAARQAKASPSTRPSPQAKPIAAPTSPAMASSPSRPIPRSASADKVQSSALTSNEKKSQAIGSKPNLKLPQRDDRRSKPMARPLATPATDDQITS